MKTYIAMRLLILFIISPFIAGVIAFINTEAIPTKRVVDTVFVPHADFEICIDTPSVNNRHQRILRKQRELEQIQQQLHSGEIQNKKDAEKVDKLVKDEEKKNSEADSIDSVDTAYIKDTSLPAPRKRFWYNITHPFKTHKS